MSILKIRLLIAFWESIAIILSILTLGIIEHTSFNFIVGFFGGGSFTISKLISLIIFILISFFVFHFWFRVIDYSNIMTVSDDKLFKTIEKFEISEDVINSFRNSIFKGGELKEAFYKTYSDGGFDYKDVHKYVYKYNINRLDNILTLISTSKRLKFLNDHKNLVDEMQNKESELEVIALK